MAEKKILFNRGDELEHENSHEDMWDDTALVEAYDRAVNLAKEKLDSQSSQLNLGDENPGSTSSSHVSDEEQLGSTSKSTQKTKYMFGEDVRAVYSEDGMYYEAIIMSIDEAKAMCRVRFIGYSNEEDVFLKDLKPSHGPLARKEINKICWKHIHDPEPESFSDMEQESKVNHTPSKPSSAAGLDWKPAKPEPLPKFPGMSNVSSIPPPPPPTAWPISGSEEMDSDSLYSMLMSWYMAGYHTGYYQGVQQRNKTKVNDSVTSGSVESETMYGNYLHR